MRTEKVAVIREGMVEVCGDFITAVVLNQFVYWSERVTDFDAFVEEEKRRSHGEVDFPLTNGWIYKTAEQLSEETLLRLSPPTMRKYITNLVDLGFLEERSNPSYAWDRTLQYRPNIGAIQFALAQKGFCLAGYTIDFTPPNSEFFAIANKESLAHKSEIFGAIPEITTEITKKNVSIEEKTEIAPEVITVITTEPHYSRAEKGDIMRQLEEHFNRRTNIPLPKRKSTRDKTAGAVNWWIPLWDLYCLTHSLEVSLNLIDKAVDALKANKLTVSSPKSIEKTAISMYSDLIPRSGKLPVVASKDGGVYL